jgi:hypothetical protein
MQYRAALLLASGSIARALAQDDLAALDVADKAPQAPEARSHEWHALIEAAYDHSSYGSGVDLSPDSQRLSLDVRYDHPLALGLRVVLADRLDVDRQEAPTEFTEINTVKEAYLSWRESPDRILDLGRINVRNGVALGYNPTDYFRFDAVRSVVSINPVSLRENRLGSVMLRGQQVWTGGSLTAIVSPRLQDEPSDGPFSADLGATNGSNRWLLAASQRFGQDFAPQLLIMGSEHEPVQGGINLTHLLGSATVAFVEFSGGQGPTLIEQATGGSGPTSFTTRLATGLTYTAPNNLSVTLEYDQNDAAPQHNQWIALRQASLTDLERVVKLVTSSQELPDRHALFTHATWTDSLWQHLDLDAFAREDLDDHSRLAWTEARYHWTHLDLALQWQLSRGAPGTVYGSASPRTLAQLLVDWYLP